MKAKRFATALISIIYVIIFLLCVYSGPVEKGAVYVPIKGPYRITFSGGTYPADAEELRFPIESGDFQYLSYFTGLKSADFSGSLCVPEIIKWSEENPQVSVRYTVNFPNGLSCDNYAEELDLSGTNSSNVAQTAEMLGYLPNVKSIDLGSSSAEASLSGEELSAIKAAAPGAKLSYCIDLLGEPVSLDVTSLDLSHIGSADVESVCATLSCMPDIQSVELGAQGDNDLSFEDIALLQAAAPGAVFNYAFTLWGQSISVNDESMNFSHIPMDDEGAAVREVMPCMKNCSFVDMDTCGVSNASMAQLRADFPDTKFVWRVWFGENYSVRTDVEKILASKPSKGGTLYDYDMEAISYCQDLKYLDIGHNENITDLSFAYGTPKLEVLIIAMNPLTDITPLSACSHLEYIELNSTGVGDLSPLSNLQELRHLNLGNCPNVSDISPLYGLKDLERLWLGCTDPVPPEQVAQMQENAPDCIINTEVGDDPTGGNWRFADLKAEGWVTMKKYGYFTYENHPRYDLLREQFGYDDGLAAYSFSWNDPLY